MRAYRISAVLFLMLSIRFGGEAVSACDRATAKTPRIQPIVSFLRKLPEVDSVKLAVSANKPKHRIIHLLNWHFVPKASFAVDIRDVAEKPVPDEEIDRLYSAFLEEVDAVQKEQMAVLRHLIRHHGVRNVFIEGLTKKELPGLNRFIETLRKWTKPKGDTPLEKFFIDQYRLDVLELGAAGRLVLSGELKGVLPVEDAKLLDAANPIGKDGEIRFDKKANKLREDAIVRAMMKGGNVAVIILGGAHDLSDNVQSLSRGSTQYMRVQTKAYRKAASGKE